MRCLLPDESSGFNFGYAISTNLHNQTSPAEFMLSEIFNPGAYWENFYALPPRITAITILCLGGFIYWRERGSRIGRQYFLFDLSVFVWLFSASVMMASADENVAMFWSRSSQVGVFFMYATIYHFGVLFIGYEKKKKTYVRAAWLMAIAFSAINVFTETYINDLYKYWWGWYTKYNWLPTFFLIGSSFFVVTGLMYILQVYQQSSVGTLQRKRAKGLLIGFGFGMVAFVDTLAAYGVGFYPCGYAGVLIHTFITATLTWRYRLVDITPEVAAKEIIHTMSDAVLVLDNEHIIRVVNPKAKELFRCGSADLLDHYFDKALPAEEISRAVGSLLECGTTKDAEIPYFDNDGISRVMNVSISPIYERNDNVIAYTCVFRDVTEHKKAREVLERRVAERTTELAIARDQALEAIRTKSAFLANMSHELRTPLNAIIGYSELLHDESLEKGKKSTAYDLRRISVAGNQLLELINSVLDLSKIEAGKMELNLGEFEVAESIEDVIEAYEPAACQRGNRLCFQLAPNIGTIVADREKVELILAQLVSNACKFTENGDITVRAERNSTDNGEWIYITVADTGFGMTQSEQEQLFGKFTQMTTMLPNVQRGPGLGLAISQRLSELMGGVINVESELGDGTKFTLRLPTVVASANLNENAGVTTADAHPRRR